MIETQAADAVGASVRPAVIDCDIHNVVPSHHALMPFLSDHWRDYVSQTSFKGPVDTPYPPNAPMTARPGSAPEEGPPGSSLALIREQALDAWGTEIGILNCAYAVESVHNPDAAAAMASAVNDWQVAKWLNPEPRLRGSICVTSEDPEAAIAEIERWAGDRSFVQVAFTPRTLEPLGRKRYWPVLECAAAHGLPIALHADVGGKRANSGSGWFGYYWEEHTAYILAMQTLITSLIMEGVFERVPGLKVVAVEGGFAWAPALGWRLDKNWARMRKEVPHVKRPPSAYMRENVWYTTQPIEEPERPNDLLDIIRWIGADRLLFSTDYPHWDFDDPRTAFKVRLPVADRQAIFAGNARRLYRLDA